MTNLNEINHLEIFVLMDNAADPFTQNVKGMYWNESQYRYGIKKRKEMSGSDYCRACNGLSLFIKVYTDDTHYTFLFDTGPDEGLVVENAARMELDLVETQAIVLSHGHFDHYGGTKSVLNAIGKSQLPVYTHPELFNPRAFGKEAPVFVSDLITPEMINENGGKTIITKDPISIFDNHVLISGEVPRETSYETGSPSEYQLKGNQWVKSPNVTDERCLVMRVKNKGTIVMTACGHTGVINATEYARQLFNDDPIYAIMGGFHLAGPELNDRIEPTIQDLVAFDPQYIITGHCTGRNTQAKLTQVFGQRHIPYGVGAYLKL